MIKKTLQIWNWHRFLKFDPSYTPRWKEVVSSFFIGESLRFILPGGYGIVGKIYFVANKKKATFISVGIEKFFQIWTSLTFATIAAAFYFDDIALHYKIIVNVIIISLPVLAVLIQHFVKHASIKTYLIQYFRYAPNIILRSFIIMFVTILQYHLIINNFHGISFLDSLIIVPLILSANLLPVTYAGLGLRETFAIGVLSKFGIDPETAVACSLSIFAFSSLLPALIGVFFVLRSKQKVNS